MTPEEIKCLSCSREKGRAAHEYLANNKHLFEKHNAALKRMFGVSRSVIVRARKRAGMPPSIDPRVLKAKRARKTIPNDKMLGKVPDTVLAEKYGVSAKVIKDARDSVGIPPFPGGRKGKIKEKLKKDPELKTATTAHLARKYDCSDTMIKRLRRDMGIVLEKKYNGFRPRTRVAKKAEEDATKNYGLLSAWKCIPERVGLTKNQWLRRHEDRT